MIRETIASAVLTCAIVLLISSGMVGIVEPWHGVVLALVALIFGAIALLIVEREI